MIINNMQEKGNNTKLSLYPTLALSKTPVMKVQTAKGTFETTLFMKNRLRCMKTHKFFFNITRQTTYSSTTRNLLLSTEPGMWHSPVKQSLSKSWKAKSVILAVVKGFSTGEGIPIVRSRKVKAGYSI